MKSYLQIFKGTLFLIFALAINLKTAVADTTYPSCSRKMERLISALERRDTAEAVRLSGARNLKPNCLFIGVAPLAYAARYGQLTVVENLLKVGANPNIRSSGRINSVEEWGDDFTPLFAARSNLDIVSKLVDSGADVNARDTLGKTPTHLAADDLFSNDDVLNYLISKSPEALTEKDNNGCYPLHFAAHSATKLSSIFSKLTSAQINSQLASRCNFEHISNNYPKSSNVTPFDIAATYKKVDAIKVLLSYGFPKYLAASIAIDLFSKPFLNDVLATGYKLEAGHLYQIGKYWDRFNMVMPNLGSYEQKDLDRALFNLVSDAYWDFEHTIPMAKAFLDLGANPYSKDNCFQQDVFTYGNNHCGAQSNPWQSC